ncbi:4711_t:CDS:2, partial [Funneliformis geosporum]
SMNTTLRNTEPNKQSSWILNIFKQYEDKCKRNEITPTHIKYMQKILESLKISTTITTIAQAQWEERKPQDAYFAKAEEEYEELELEDTEGEPQHYLNRIDKYWKGPGQCLFAKVQIEEDDELIEITKGKDVPIGSLTNVQRMQLQQLLTKNKDLFANDKSELTQTNVAQHSIITEN